MKKVRAVIVFIMISNLAVFIDAALAEIHLPRLINNGMVLQRNTEVKIWGWASAGEKVKIRFRRKTYQTTADSNKTWVVLLEPMSAGGPFDMVISGDNQIFLTDILIGDVWLSSGQSNMEHNMNQYCGFFEKQIIHAQNDKIRYFNVSNRFDFNGPQTKLSEGSWEKVSPQTAKNFSAVAYFFAQNLYDTYRIPVGIINASVAGSPVEAWISAEKLNDKFPGYYRQAQLFTDSVLVHKIKLYDQHRIDFWYEQLQKNDRGYQNPKKPWYASNITMDGWYEINIPGYWTDSNLSDLDGVVWFRKSINVPSKMVGKPAKIRLGRIIDADSVFVNGFFVGSTSYQFPRRCYQLPEDVLREGINHITIRVINFKNQGGFIPDKPYYLSAANDTINLTGKWKYQVGAVVQPLEEQTDFKRKPVGLYNAMIAPLENFQIKGVIWYQGEANRLYAANYESLLKALINDWREQRSQENLPFIIVQLPNYGKPSQTPDLHSGWAFIREAQRKMLDLPGTGLAVTIDIGEWNDIHPMNKEIVGKRLALAARDVAYEEKGNLGLMGPLYQSARKEGNSIVISFTQFGNGLVTDNNQPPKEFIIANTDKKYAFAKAEIISPKEVRVWNVKVPDPIEVRYAWGDNPEKANLYNSLGLPASPFRAYITEEN